jgi:beta-N-acetylhexosaminidase
MMDKPAPVIFGCSGLILAPEEKGFFAEYQPLGFILFGRNVQDKQQLKALVDELKKTVSHPNPPILIDQEGGRVARLKAPNWYHPPSAAELAQGTLEEAKIKVLETYTNIAKDLKEMGITVDCVPMLDIHVSGADPIMGDRTFSDDPHVVGELGAVVIKVLEAEGITPVMKHIPGHGAATCDSHNVLPVVDLTLKELEPHFAPFRANKDCPWAMTAHIVYSALDPHHPATQSPIIIQDIIRNYIGFKGFLISDDVGMNALSGSFAERTRRSLEAGCDAVLHCSGILSEMRKVMEGI